MDVPRYLMLTSLLPGRTVVAFVAELLLYFQQYSALIALTVESRRSGRMFTLLLFGLAHCW